jgi:hypothetical protein
MAILCRYVGWVAVVCAQLAHGADECGVAAIVEPAQRVIADTRPTFAWEALPGVERYRLRLHSRVPEGESLVTIDTLVEGLRFTPPRPLASRRAIVKVLVTAPCESPPALDTGVRLFLDAGLTCRMSELAYDDQSGAWHWNPVAGASSYEVLRYAMPHGELLERRELHAPVALRLERGTVVAVRARCTNGYSDWVLAP